MIEFRPGQRWVWAKYDNIAIVEILETKTITDDKMYFDIKCRLLQNVKGRMGAINHIDNWSFGAGYQTFWKLLEGQDAPI